MRRKGWLDFGGPLDLLTALLAAGILLYMVLK
jgi:hypothetical protein